VSQAAPSTSPKPDAQAQGDEADKAMEQLARFGSILRRRWLIVSVTSVLAISGAFVAISMLKPEVARQHEHRPPPRRPAGARQE
jgi:hypothetical protein